jgi:hypothetical protein
MNTENRSAGMPIPAKKVLCFLFIGMAAFLLVCLLVNCLFNAPEGDMFYYAAVTRQYGFWEAQKHWYLIWSGRLISTFLLSFADYFIRHVWLYQLASMLIILAFYVTIFAGIKKCFQFKERGSLWLCVALFLLALTQVFASVSSTYYWLPASLTYTCPMILGVWGVFFVFHSKMVLRLAGMMILFLFGFFNEITSLLMIVLFVFLWISLKGHEQKRRQVIYGFIPVLISALLLYTAPGNFARKTGEHGNLNLIEVFLYSNKSLLLDSLNWLGSSPVLLIALLALILRVLPEGLKAGIRPLFKSKGLLYGFIYAGLLIPYLFFYKLGGAYPPDRAINIVSCIFLVALFFLFVDGFSAVNLPAFVTENRFNRFVLGILSLLIFFNFNAHDKNISAIVTDASGRGASYAAEYGAQIETLKRATGDSVVLPPISHVAPSISFGVLNADTGTFFNFQCRYYFRKKQITVSK